MKAVAINRKAKCPECGTSWRGSKISKKHLHLYPKGVTHYTRVTSLIEHDRLVGWRCPGCRKEWRVE